MGQNYSGMFVNVPVSYALLQGRCILVSVASFLRFYYFFLLSHPCFGNCCAVNPQLRVALAQDRQPIVYLAFRGISFCKLSVGILTLAPTRKF